MVLCYSWKMEIRTFWESKVAGTSQPWCCRPWNVHTHQLRVQKWREHVSHDGAAYRIEIRTSWESKGREHINHDCAANGKKLRTAWGLKVAGTCQHNGADHEMEITHPLKVKSGGNMSAVTMQLMEWKYALPERAKKKMGGMNMSAIIVQIMNWTYTPAGS